MRIRRDISSIPHRSASETWQQIVDLVTGPDSQDVKQLTEATGVIGSIIVDEHPSVQPIVIEGVGAQLRIYCRYGMEAVEEGSAVDPLTWNPTAGDWTMYVPCDSDNITWVKTSLAKTSPRIRVFDIAKAERFGDEESQTTRTGKTIAVDWDLRR